MKKRITSLFLVLCMLMSLLVTVSHATDSQACTGEHSTWTALSAEYVTDNQVEGSVDTLYAAGDGAKVTTLTLGTYGSKSLFYLSNDLDLSVHFNAIYVHGDVTLCLGGKTLTYNRVDANNDSYTALFLVEHLSSLTICDCASGGTITHGNTEHKAFNGVCAVLAAGENSRVTLQGGTIQNFSRPDGAAIQVENKTSSLTISGGTLQNNGCTAETKPWDNAAFDPFHGGAVYCNGTFTMTGGTIKDNSVYGLGAGVYVTTDGVFNMTGGTISGNKSTYTQGGTGGGVCVAGTFNMSGGTISENNAYTGAGIYGSDGNVTISGEANISNNTATGLGGGIRTSGESRLKMTGGTISGNKATSGGGIYIGAAATLTGGTISGHDLITYNTNTSNGGGIYFNNGSEPVVMSGVSITSNKATNGGGFFANTGAVVTVDGATSITSNEGTNGAAIRSNGILTINNGTISSNVATAAAAIYTGGTLYIKGGTISGNTAPKLTGGICVNSATAVLTVSGGTLTNNKYNVDAIAALRDIYVNKSSANGVTVTGGCLDGKFGLASGTTITLSGGRYKNEPTSNLATGYSAVKDSANTTFPYAVISDTHPGYVTFEDNFSVYDTGSFTGAIAKEKGKTYGYWGGTGTYTAEVTSDDVLTCTNGRVYLGTHGLVPTSGIYDFEFDLKRTAGTGNSILRIGSKDGDNDTSGSLRLWITNAASTTIANQVYFQDTKTKKLYFLLDDGTYYQTTSSTDANKPENLVTMPLDKWLHIKVTVDPTGTVTVALGEKDGTTTYTFAYDTKTILGDKKAIVCPGSAGCGFLDLNTNSGAGAQYVDNLKITAPYAFEVSADNADTTHGTVTVDKSYGHIGETVKVTVEHEEGYIPETLTVNGKSLIITRSFEVMSNAAGNKVTSNIILCDHNDDNKTVTVPAIQANCIQGGQTETWSCNCRLSGTSEPTPLDPEEAAYVYPYKVTGLAPRVDDLVFAGWFNKTGYDISDTCTDNNAHAYARFVAKNVLTVQAQKSAPDANNKFTLRLVTSVAGLNYKEVGFNITYLGDNVDDPADDVVAAPVSSRTVYTKILENDTYTDASKAFENADSTHFMTFSITEVPAGASFIVTPFWVTLDGTTVHGKELRFNINDLEAPSVEEPSV